MAKILGARWSQVPPENKTLYEQRAAQDKARYEREMAEYRGGGKKLKAMTTPTLPPPQQVVEEEEEEEEEEEDDD